MTRKIRTTDAHLLLFLRKTVSTLFERYEQLESYSEYWILFERETRDTYSLSFWRKPAIGVSGSKIEIPLTGVDDHLWLECSNKNLDDLPRRIFDVPLRPYMTFNLTFTVITKHNQAPLIVLKALKPAGFGGSRLLASLPHEARTATA